MNAKIYYAKTLTFLEANPDQIDLDNLSATHVFVCDLDVTYLDEAFQKMQAHHWSPNGEARPLIESLALTHTSMSVGDIVEYGGVYWMTMWGGWQALTPRPKAQRV